MNRFLFLVFLVYFSVLRIAKAQIIVPQNSYFEYSGNDYFIEEATITNNFDVITTFVWERKVVSMPPDWQTSICDPNSCHIASVNTYEVTLAAKATDILDCNFYMGKAPELGTAVVELKVYPKDKPEQFTTVTYTGKLTSLIASIDQQTSLFDNNFNIVYSNLLSKINIQPKSSNLIIDNIVLRNTIGNIVTESTNTNTVEQPEINITQLANGIYFLEITNHSGETFIKKILL